MTTELVKQLNEDAFWQRVEKTDYCWIWTSHRNYLGYGMAWLAQKQYRAHRISWVLANGKSITRKDLVCHSCDNPSCVNPEHLWLGDYKSNTRDSINKGRASHPPVKKKYDKCDRGHQLIEGNLYYSVRKETGYLRRDCINCQKIRMRKFILKKERNKK